MRRLFFGLVVALSSAGLAAADDKAEAIVKKGIEAHGGADALNKYKAGRFKMNGEISILGMDLEFTGDVAYSLPDRYRMEMTTEIMGMKMVIRQMVKGETIKSTVNVGGMDVPSPGGELEKEELKMAAVIQEAEQLTPLLDAKKFTIKAADDDDVDGKKAAVVVVTPKAIDKELKLYFDKKTGMLVKSTHKGVGTGEGGTPVGVMEDTFYQDYKKVKGVQVPSKLVVNHDGKKFLTISLSDYELLEKLGDKDFATDD